ncbi:HAMP domain-containing protein [bacterium]|nr:HAMP domain-containing protein [bacterium]
MRLSVKFSLVISSLFFVTIVLLIFININQNKLFLQNEVRKKGQTLAQAASISCLDPFLKMDFATLRRYCESIARDEDVTTISILDTDYIIKMNNNIQLLGDSWKDEISSDLGYYQLIDSIRLADTVIGYVYITMNTLNIQDELKQLVFKNILLGAGLTLIGLVFALFMAKRITTPLNALTIFASRVAEGDFNTIPESSSSDEVGILSRSFNLMISNLKTYIDARTRNERLTMAGRLSSVIAHEIRNPLEPIKGAATMLRMKNPDNVWVNKYTNIIEEEVENLSDFIDNFLDFTRSGAPSFKKMNINTLINQIKDLTADYIRQHGNDLTLVLDNSISDSYFDPNNLKQVIMNFIINSVQAMEGLHGVLEIVTTLEQLENEGKVLIVKVKDNGVGIKPDILEKLFEPYFSNKEQGTGLGLFISQLLIEKHGGKLLIESRFGEWTEVLMWIPFKEEQDES